MRTRQKLVHAAILLAAVSCSPPETPTPPVPPVATVAPTAKPQAPPPAGPIDDNRLMAHVEALCAPALRGRGAFTDDEVAAGKYIAAQLDLFGVAPLGNVRHQTFTVGEDKSANILGAVRCKSCAHPDEWIVLGAHYDHEGVVDGEIYFGAEDNASGVAVALEIARVLNGAPESLERSLAIVFFGAEERGLWGSKHFAGAPPVKVMAMVNIDMIGRPLADMEILRFPKSFQGIDDRRSVGVYGTQDRPGFRALVDAAFAAHDQVAIGPENLGKVMRKIIEGMAKNRGDSFMFEHAGIPALFFSSGESADYHLPSDTADKLEPDIMLARAKAITDAVIALTKLEEYPPAFSKHSLR